MKRVPSRTVRAFTRATAAISAAVLAVTLSVVASSAAHAAAPRTTPAVPARAAAAAVAFDVLLFTKTAGFRHENIPAGIAAVQKLGQDNGFLVTATEDASVFTEANLAQYEAVIFLSTTGDVLDANQQAAFEHYIETGGGYAGIHAASDTEYDWPWYGKLVGAYFKDHPAEQTATVKVEDHAHPSTAELPDRWSRFDEWYNFRTNPRDTVHVLASLDERSYTAGSGAMGSDHPTAWCQAYDGGRSWYTGGGHTVAAFSDPQFLAHVLGGIETAAGVVDGDCSATQSASYEKVTLDANTSNPMVLDVADDGTVFYAERDGRIRIIDATTHQTTTAVTLPVTQANEDGLLGLVLDPDFDTNHWLYAYWSPSNVAADGPHNRISRFTYDPVAKTIALSSEASLLKVTTQRETCCHAGGDMLFDANGDLYLATGDNTNPFESSGFSPIDERAGHVNDDAQRTAANTNDLRGKLLRIHPEANGTYTVPAGNMFPAGTAKTRPEIFAMGFRNPFRLGLDHETGHVVLGDYGPDSSTADPLRGPAGAVEWNVVSQPGFYGWPYCTGANTAYVDYNFATGHSGAPFSCAGATNNSPNNTGLTTLPAAIGAEVWYTSSGNAQFPEIGGGGAPMGGPVYQYDEASTSTRKWPAYWDGKALFGEWNQGKLYSFQLTGDDRDDIVDINRVLPGLVDPGANLYRPMDFEFGPDGALYIIDWGADFGGNNATSGIYRIDYVQGDPSPVARASADVTSGAGPLTVHFSSEGTHHPKGAALTLQWTFGDGSAPSAEANPTHTYTANGSYTAQLTATDPAGNFGVANLTIVVGNVAPTVTLDFPDNGGFFEWGDQVRYEITVTDPDGTVDCSKVKLFTSLGHESHAHPMQELTGCEGNLQTTRDEGHGIDARIFWVVEAQYEDDGGDAGTPLRGNDLQILQPKLMQAEFYTSTGRTGSSTAGEPGVQREATSDTSGGGQNIGFIEAGDWWAYSPTSLLNIDSLTLRAASPNGNATVSVRWDSPTGPQLGTATVPSTGGWQTYQDVDIALSNVPTGTGTLYFVSPSGGLNVNWFVANGSGVTSNVRPSITDFTVAPLTGTAPLTVTASASATDPEGDAVTLAWDDGLGAGFEDGTGTFEATYVNPGTYRLQVRATDAGGAWITQYTTVTVEAPDAISMCFSGRSDDFLGSTLDEDRWTVLNRDQSLAVQDGRLVIPASKTDIFAGSNTPVPNLVLQPLPGGAFTATAKITLEARVQYQQAGLLIYGDDDNYAKMVIQGRTTTPNAAARIFQFIREEQGTPNEVAASNTAELGAAFPDTYYVRFTSDGSDLKASYSADGVDFTAMPQTKSLAGISNPRIGLVAFANPGSAPAPINASVDWFQITPDDTATAPGPDDEFTGSALDTCRWTVVRSDPTAMRVSGGALELDTSPTDIYGGSNTNVPNIVVQDQPEGDWSATTKVDGSALDRQYQQGGLILYGDDDNYVKLDYVTDNAAGSPVARRLELRSEVAGVVQNPQPSRGELTQGVWWLKLTKSGTTFTGAYSADGESWTQLAETVANPAVSSARVGLYALGGPETASSTATFDFFRIGGSTPLTVTTSLDPSAPTGSNGWYTATARVAVATSGGPSGAQVYREYALDGGAWAEYTTPVVVSGDGTHTVKVRASAGSDQASADDVVVTIDGTVPTAQAALSSDRKVALSAVDPTSGVADVSYSLDATHWSPYTAPVAVGAAASAFSYKVTDEAGNVLAGTFQVEPLDVTVSASTRVLAGRQYVSVVATNNEAVAVDLTIDTAYGSRTFGGVLPGRSANVSFNSRLATIGAGEATVTVRQTGTTGGTPLTLTAAYPAS